jgi:hypothetical protein
MKTSLASLVLTTASLSAVVNAQFRQKTSCPNNGEALEFRFFTDAQSFLENGWHLQCEYEDGTIETVWDVQPGSLKYTASTQVIRESTCVEPTTSCWLTIYDLEGDGLLAVHPKNGFAGWFALLHGARTVAVYSNEPTPAFEELQYCVGPKCELTPQEISGGNGCEEAYLYLQTDGMPQDTSYELVCNGETLWKRSGFSQPGAFVEEETCIANDLCCTFTVNDADTRGMTTPTDNGMTGFIYLEWNYEGLLEHDGVTGEEFDTKSVEFGHGCRQPWQDEVEFPVEDVNDPASYGDHGAVFGRPISDDLFGTVATSRGLSDNVKIILFTLAGLILSCCLVVLLFYRRALMRDDREHIKDDPTIVGSPTQDNDPSFKGEPLSGKDEHAEPDVLYGDDFDSDDDIVAGEI